MTPASKADDIRRAARRLFLRSGLRGTSMDAIAAEANVSKQTLYRHFGSKDQLFVGVLVSMSSDRLSADVAELLPTRLQSTKDLEGTLIALARRILDFLLASEYRELMRVVIAEVRDFPELASLFRSSVVERGAAALANLLACEHVSALVSVHDPDPALRLFVGPLLSYVLEELIEDPLAVRRRAEAEIAPIVALFVAAISRPPAAHPDGVRSPDRDGGTSA